MPSAIIQNKKKIKIQGSLETLRPLTLNQTLYCGSPHTWVKHCPQWFERRREEYTRKKKGKRKRESSQFQLGPCGGSWRLKWCIICKSIWLLFSCIRLPLWTSLRSLESSAPCLCCSVLIRWISFWTHVHLSSPNCTPATCSWCIDSSWICPTSSSWPSCTCILPKQSKFLPPRGQFEIG